MEGWIRGSRECMPFSESGENLLIIMMTAISAWWTFPNTKRKRSGNIVYPSISSSIAPVNHGPELPIPQPPTTPAVSKILSEDDDADFEVDTQSSSKDPHFPHQNELDDLTRDLGLTKAKEEILSSGLKELNLLALLCEISMPRKRHVTFANIYTMSSDSDHPSLCYCTDTYYIGLVSKNWYCLLPF